MRRRGARSGARLIFGVLVASQLLRPAGAEARSRIDGPCPGCRAALAGSTAPAPLVVLLHGDGETAGALFDAWAPAAEARGMAVLAPACPRTEGCSSQSWWRWNGDPAWLLEQARGLSARQALDAERMWIIGWSGGASYVGYRTQELERAFAAIVVHGGGIPPARSDCVASGAGVYFLVGDANPLHALAVELRDYYGRCDHDVTWTLLRGADHAAEWRALGPHREAILDWLATRRLARAASPGTSSDPVAVSDAASPPAGGVSSSSAPPAPPAPPAASCRCSATRGHAPAQEERTAWALAASVVAATLRRRQGRAPFTR